nr:MAG TPA: hypothetical protein [Caudoviricetes sp.]
MIASSNADASKRLALQRKFLLIFYQQIRVKVCFFGDIVAILTAHNMKKV